MKSITINRKMHRRVRGKWRIGDVYKNGELVSRLTVENFHRLNLVGITAYRPIKKKAAAPAIKPVKGYAPHDLFDGGSAKRWWMVACSERIDGKQIAVLITPIKKARKNYEQYQPAT